jgi:hypothetical protein
LIPVVQVLGSTKSNMVVVIMAKNEASPAGLSRGLYRKNYIEGNA